MSNTRLNSFKVISTIKNEVGFMLIDGYISKANYPMIYNNWDTMTTQTEYIPLEELQKVVETSQTLGLIVTNNHPWELVHASNVKNVIEGVVLSTGEIEDDKLRVSIQIMDAVTINDIESGLRSEFSIGYTCDLMETENGDGLGADFKQINLNLNHVALVEHGRAGEDVGVIKSNSKVDCKLATEVGLYKINSKEGCKEMVIKYNEKDYSETEIVALLVEKQNAIDEVTGNFEVLNSTVETVKSERDALVAEKEALVAETETLKGNITGLEAKLNSLEADLHNQLEARLNSMVEYQSITNERYNGSDVEADLLAKKVEILKENGIDVENKSTDFITGAFASMKLNSYSTEKAVTKVNSAFSNFNFNIKK